MSDYTPIPDDLWPQIFLNSSPETLIRCRCVCKSWRSLISSPSFISSHLSSQQPLFLARESPSLQQPNSSQDYLLLFRPRSLPSLDFRIRSDPHPNLSIIGTVNGLLCLTETSRGEIAAAIALWNPLIRRCAYLPSPFYSSSGLGYTSTLGFGLDPSTNELKIVRVANVGLGPFRQPREFPLTAEVFSVRDWKWRPIDYSKLRELSTFPNPWSQCLLNNGSATHWVASLRRSYRRYSRGILSFDFATEEFNIIELPQEIQLRSDAKVRVTKAGSLLCALDCKRTYACDVWAMHEYGQVSSWCKMVSLSWEEGGIIDVMWVREDFGEVIVSTESEEVFTYDPRNQVAKSVGFRCKGDGCFADGFVGSLLLMDVQHLDDN